MKTHPWPPPYLTKVYANVVDSIGFTPFSFQEFQKITGFDTTRANLLLHFLRKSLLVVRLKRNRPRMYYPLSIDFHLKFLVNTELWETVRSIKLERFVPLVLSLWNSLRKSWPTASAGIFGSVATGNAKESSDVDILILKKELPNSPIDRVKYFLPLRNQMRKEIELLDVDVNFLILEPSEIEFDNPFLYDIAEALTPIVDNVGFIRDLISRARIEQSRNGWLKKFSATGDRYWIKELINA